MRLGINAKRLTGKRTGVGRYILNLITEWNRMSLPFEQVVLYTFTELDAGIPQLSSVFDVQRIDTKLPMLFLENPLLSARAKDVDLFFSPSYMLPLGYRGRCVVTIHDMLQEIFPETFPWWSRYRYGSVYRYSARRAEGILTDSENSKRDICKYYHVDEEKVKAIPLAADPIFRPIQDADALEQVRQKYSLGAEPFFLFVGKLAKRRNMPNLIQAFKELKTRHRPAHRLMIVGLNTLALNIQGLIEELGLGGQVLYMPYIPDEELVLLYNAADAFVYPSEYEGFGLPVLEAMACGTPVITLDNSSLSEVAEGAALLLKSASVQELCEAMYALSTDTSRRQELIDGGLERSRQFSWERTAKETMAYLKVMARG